MQNGRQDRLVGSPLDGIGARLGVFVDFVAQPPGRGVAQPSLRLVHAVERNDGNSLWHWSDIGGELAAEDDVPATKVLHRRWHPPEWPS